MRPLRFLSTLALVIALVGCSSAQKIKTIPAELRGLWRTGAEPKFDGHTFELQERSIVIASPEEPGVEQSVVRVEKRDENGKMLYTIHTLTPERDEDVWNLYFEPENGGTIRFVSQRTIEWTRQAAAIPAAPAAPANTPTENPEPPAESRE